MEISFEQHQGHLGVLAAEGDNQALFLKLVVYHLFFPCYV